MQMLSERMKFKHALLLFQRKKRQSFFQTLPSIMFSFLFSQIYFTLITDFNDRNYIWIYLILSIILTLIISIVIYFREASIELKSFSYLLLVGYKKKDIHRIIIIKWCLIFLIGYAIATILFFLFNMGSQLFININYLIRIIFRSFLLNLILLLGVVVSILNFKLNNEKLHSKI